MSSKAATRSRGRARQQSQPFWRAFAWRKRLNRENNTMRLYNPRTAVPTSTSVHHFNRQQGQDPQEPSKPASFPKLKSLVRRQRASNVNDESTVLNSGNRGIRKLRAIWPPPQAEASSADADMVLTKTASTTDVSANHRDTESMSEKWEQEPSVHEDHVERPAEEAEVSREGPPEQRDDNDVAPTTRTTQQRQISSAFRSPLRLSKIHVPSSSGQLLLQRLQSKMICREPQTQFTTNLLEASTNCALPQSINAAHRTNNEGTGSLRSLTPETSADKPVALKFQSPMRKSDLLQLEPQQQQNSPETNTTATTQTYDELQERNSSESFCIDIALVKSTETTQREQGLHRKSPVSDNDSLVSKSSSSTLTSQWCGDGDGGFDSPQKQRDLNNTTTVMQERCRTRGFPSSENNGVAFQTPAEEGKVVTGFSGAAADSQRDEDATAEEGRPSLDLFGTAWSGETWSDGDSWIDFTADPFKTVRHRITKPCPTKPEDLLPPAFVSLSDNSRTQIQSKESSQVVPEAGWPLRAKPSHAHSENKVDTSAVPGSFPLRRGPLLLGQLLQSKRSAASPHDSLFANPSTSTVDPKEQTETSRLGKEEDAQHCAGIEDESKLPEKYDKMLRMGLPEGAVRNAMMRDGVPTLALDCMASAEAPATTVLSTTRLEGDHFRRFRVHWDTHDNVRSNSVWAMAQREEPWIAECINVDEEEFALLFQETKHAESKKKVVRKENVGLLIDPKRANNAGIILSRIKMSYREIARAIDEFGYELLSVDQIRGLMPFLPTAEEEAKLRNHISKAGGKQMLKSECEKFMAAVMSIRQARKKLEAMLFMKQFPALIDGLTNDARLVKKACEEVMGSSRLRRLLGVLLGLGNRLNTAGQSGKERASAIRLESFSRLSQGKAFDKKTTFLQYVVRVLRRSSPETLRLREELPTVRSAEKVIVEQMYDDVTGLEERIAEMRQAAFQVGRDVVKEEEALSTAISRFTVGASSKMESVYQEMETLKSSHAALLRYFGEEPHLADDAQPRVFSVLSTFCDELDSAVERAVVQERAARRGMKSHETKGGGVPR